jgi:hypothetical protein
MGPTPKCHFVPKLGLLQFWGLIISCANLWLRWGLKQSCSPCWELSNSMWHTTYTQVNQGNSQILIIGSQIGNLTPGLSSGHNLWFKYPNGSCKPILDIYVLRSFQRYKELFKQMNFDPCNPPLKIRESIGTPTPKVRTHLEVWGFIPSSYTPESMKCDFRASHLARTFASPCFGYEPKARVMTFHLTKVNIKSLCTHRVSLLIDIIQYWLK